MSYAAEAAPYGDPRLRPAAACPRWTFELTASCSPGSAFVCLTGHFPSSSFQDPRANPWELDSRIMADQQLQYHRKARSQTRQVVSAPRPALGRGARPAQPLSRQLQIFSALCPCPLRKTAPSSPGNGNVCRPLAEPLFPKMGQRALFGQFLSRSPKKNYHIAEAIGSPCTDRSQEHIARF